MTGPRVLVAMPTRGYAYAPSLLTAAALARRFGRELVVEIGRPIELVRTRLESTHWKRRLPTVAMVSQTAIGEYYLRPVDY